MEDLNVEIQRACDLIAESMLPYNDIFMIFRSRDNLLEILNLSLAKHDNIDKEKVYECAANVIDDIILIDLNIDLYFSSDGKTVSVPSTCDSSQHMLHESCKVYDTYIATMFECPNISSEMICRLTALVSRVRYMAANSIWIKGWDVESRLHLTPKLSSEEHDTLKKHFKTSNGKERRYINLYLQAREYIIRRESITSYNELKYYLDSPLIYVVFGYLLDLLNDVNM